MFGSQIGGSTQRILLRFDWPSTAPSSPRLHHSPPLSTTPLPITPFVLLPSFPVKPHTSAPLFHVIHETAQLPDTILSCNGGSTHVVDFPVISPLLPSRHTKFYSIDDQVVSIGSQNMYLCALDEETNVYDDVNITKKIMDEFYNPTWNLSVDLVRPGI